VTRHQGEYYWVREKIKSEALGKKRKVQHHHQMILRRTKMTHPHFAFAIARLLLLM
jgi:hypothetical protein